MKYKFLNADHLNEAIEIVAEDLDITVVTRCANVTVTVNEVEADTLTVTLNGKEATITYGGGTSRFLRGLATLNAWVKSGETEKTVTETPHFDTNGAMVDMSRNAVMTVDTVKFMLRKMALMGLNVFMLYTEDTYEIEGYPYFGYLRGRYSKDELRELDKYALTIGIELIPCIQTLGHLDAMLRWKSAIPYRDTASVMLVDAPETYELIDNMLRTITETFTTKRIHLGLDETFDLGTGAALKRYGYRERTELYFTHLKKVLSMAEEYGLKPMMWSDMFFRLAGKNMLDYNGDYDMRVEFPENFREIVPQNVQQVFWEYNNDTVEFFETGIDKHNSFTDGIMYAGGIWTWSGHCVFSERSKANAKAALTACINKGVREVLATIWHNGSECSLILTVFGLAMYAATDYKGCFDEDAARETFKNATGLSYDDFYSLEKPELIGGAKYPITKALIYNDPMVGVVDGQVADIKDMGDYYRALSAEYEHIAEDKGFFAPAVEVIRCLTSLLENKADFGVRLKSAYDAKDKKALAALAQECDVIKEKVAALREAHRASWMLYNKPFGWEVHDIRYGGLVNRFDTAKMRINEYLSGKVDKLIELEQTKLRYDCRGEEVDPLNACFLYSPYNMLATANML